MILEKAGGRITNNQGRFDKLITSLRTALDNDGTLDKEYTSYNDIFAAFSLIRTKVSSLRRQKKAATAASIPWLDWRDILDHWDVESTAYGDRHPDMKG
jgi:hypothetical protein